MYHYPLIQRLTAVFLCLSLCIQSCMPPLQLAYKPQDQANFPKDIQTTQVLVPKKTNQANSFPLSRKPEPCLQLGAKPVAFNNHKQVFTSYSGEKISFLQEKDIWKATIEDSYLGLGINKPVPVICAKKEDLGHILQTIPQEAAKHHIHILNTPAGKCVFVGAIGLKGGMELKEKEIPRSVQDWLNEGEVCFSLGNYTDALECYDKILAVDGNHSNALIKKGMCLAALGQKQEAVACLDLALQVNPQDAAAYYRRVGILYLLEKKKAALKAFDEGPTINEGDYFAYFNKGYALSALGQKEAAIACYDKALELNPNDAQAYFNKAIALSYLGQKDKAIACYDKALELNPNQAEVYTNKGNALSSLGQKEAAIACYDKALELNPNQAESYFYKGLALSSLGQKEAAIECYDKAIKLNPNQAQAYLNKGKALSSLGHKEAAIECFDKAIKLNPNQTEVYTNKGAVLYALGHHEAAIACYDKAIDLKPNYAMAYHNKGAALYALGHKEAAIECFDKALELNPNDAQAYHKKGLALSKLGHHEAAIECFDKALELNPNYAMAYYLNKGVALFSLGHHEAAIACYDKALEMNPNYAMAYLNKGVALSSLGHHEAAIECYDKALELNPNDANAYLNKGGALSKLGHHEAAIECFDKALELNPNDANAYYNKGGALSELGHKEAAIACYDKALEMNPNDAMAYLNKGVALKGLGQHETASYYKAIATGMKAFNDQRYAEASESFDKALATAWPINSHQESTTHILTPYYFKLLACQNLQNKEEARACMAACKQVGYFEALLIRLVNNKAIDTKFLDLIYDTPQAFLADLKLIQDENTFAYLAELYTKKLEIEKRFMELRDFKQGPLKAIRKERRYQKVLQEGFAISQEAKLHEKELIKRLEAISALDAITIAKNTIKRLLKANPDYGAKLAADKLQKTLAACLQPESLLYKGVNLGKIDLLVKSFIDLPLTVLQGDLTQENKVFAAIRAVQADIVKINNDLANMALEEFGIRSDCQALIEQLNHIHHAYTSYIQQVCESRGAERKVHLQPKILLQSDGMYRYLKASVAEQILGKVTADGTLEQDEKQQLEGMHVVNKFGGLFFKYKPDFPGIEFMVSKLLDRGYLTAATRLINIKKEGKSYPFLVSKEVEGQDLHYFLEKQAADFLQKLDPKNFAYMFVLSMLTNPKDGKPDNYFVTFDKDPVTQEITTYRIIGIDNDRSFGKEMSKKSDNTYSVDLRSLLYFFPQIATQIDAAFREEFLELESELVIIDWLQKLARQNASYNAMLEEEVFIEADYADEEDGGMSLPIKLREGLVSEIYLKLRRMQAHMRQDPSLTYQALFEKIQTKIVTEYYRNTQAKVNKKFQGESGLEEKVGYAASSDLAIKGQEILASIYSLYADHTKSMQSIKGKINSRLIDQGNLATRSKLTNLLLAQRDDELNQEVNEAVKEFLNLLDRDESVQDIIWYAILKEVVLGGNQKMVELVVEKLHDIGQLKSFIANNYGQETLAILEKDYCDIARYLIQHCNRLKKDLNTNLSQAVPLSQETTEELKK